MICDDVTASRGFSGEIAGAWSERWIFLLLADVLSKRSYLIHDQYPICVYDILLLAACRLLLAQLRVVPAT